MALRTGVRANGCPLLTRRATAEHQLVDILPQHGEEQALQPIGHQARLEPPSEQPRDAVLAHHQPHSIRIGDALRVRLLGGLDDADGVGGGVADQGREEADGSAAAQLLQRRVWVRQLLVQVVVREEPWVVSHQRSARGGQSAVEEHSGARSADLAHQGWEPTRALNLHDGLGGVDWHQEDTPRCRGGRRAQRLGADGEVARRLQPIHERQHARIRSRVAEAGQRALRQRRQVAAIEPPDAALLVQRLHGGQRPWCSMTVLVVHRRAEPHQARHLEDHRRGTADTAPGRPLQRVLDDVIELLFLRVG
mmetsp:Transcript_31177/g.101544  ORF Transcript_31177/g.101544 Transcript_31177/m.101544 type:complete len:307 (+) Transcript_31177:81-1001(+)